VIIEFLNKSSVVDVARVDTLITLTLKPYSFPPPTYVSDTKTTHSMGRDNYVRVFQNRYRKCSVESRQIPSSQVPYIREFVESVDLGGLFEVDPESYQGHDALYAYCLLTSQNHTTPHGGHLLHSFSFDFEIKL
jgi:hypothetical protein